MVDRQRGDQPLLDQDEILGQASSAVSNSYNPSPLMMGAAAYIVLFLPVVVAGRWIETKFAWKR